MISEIVKVSQVFYQPWPAARLITVTSTLIITDTTKISSNNCLKSPLKMLRAINNSKYASRNGEKLTYKLSVVFVTTFLVVSPFESFLQSWIIFADGTGALHLVRKGLLPRQRGTKRVF